MAREAALSTAAVELAGVRRQYGKGDRAVHALRGIELSLPHGSFTAVMGPSGSGKSTFLQCAAGLDRPTAGSVRLGGIEITRLSENKLTELRRSRLGFVFHSSPCATRWESIQEALTKVDQIDATMLPTEIVQQ